MRPSTPIADPIDLVLLRALAEYPNITANNASSFTGEDRRRCAEWLEKFRLRGLCRIVVVTQANRERVYAAYPDLVLAAICERECQIDGGRKLLG